MIFCLRGSACFSLSELGGDIYLFSPFEYLLCICVHLHTYTHPGKHLGMYKWQHKNLSEKVCVYGVTAQGV